MDIYSDYHYDKSGKIDSHSYISSALRKATREVADNARVVDLGCGDGGILADLKRKEWRACGIDLSSSGILEARRKYPEIEFHQRGFDASLVVELGVGEFDLVISTEVIEHLYAPRELARAAFQLLKPGGIFVVTTPYHGYLKNCALALTGKLDGHFTALWDCGHIKFWSLKTLSSLLREAGFSSFRSSGAGRIPFLWKSMVIIGRKQDAP